MVVKKAFSVKDHCPKGDIKKFFFFLTSGTDLIFGESSFLPLIIIKGTIAHKPINKTQNT